MNKTFEKILERLEENTIQCKDSISFFNECGIKFISSGKAKEIVQDVAEEYNITNGDKVRSMNDDELAEFLVNFKNTYGDEYEGEMSCLDWIKSEVDN